MTPQEKAKQLVDDYYNILPLDKYVITKDYFLSWEYNAWKEAKKCAIRAVDEIMKECWDHREIDLQAGYDYWNEVKHEIEKL